MPQGGPSPQIAETGAKSLAISPKSDPLEGKSQNGDHQPRYRNRAMHRASPEPKPIWTRTLKAELGDGKAGRAAQPSNLVAGRDQVPTPPILHGRP